MRFISIIVLFGIGISIDFSAITPRNCASAADSIDEKHVHALVKVKRRQTTTTTQIPFTAFKSLEEIKVDATLSDISTFAKKQFGDHPLADEWVKRCLQLRYDKKGTATDLRRFAELHIQIMSEVNATKYAQEIVAYQVTLTELGRVAKLNRDAIYALPLDREVSADSREEQTQIIVTYDWDAAIRKHLGKLQTLHKKNAREARAKISIVAQIRFKNHPLTDEWRALYFRLSRDGKGTLSDVKRLSELEIRMFIDIDPEEYAAPIEKHHGLMKLYDKFIKQFKDAGKNPEIFQVDFKSVN